MKQRVGVIHNGVSSDLLPGAHFYAQAILKGHGTTTFGNKSMQLDPLHYRIFSADMEVVPFADGICMTLPLDRAVPWHDERQAPANVRFPIGRELVAALAELAARYSDADLPIRLGNDDELLKRIRRLVLARTAVMRARIDGLPGRSAYKRVDTYLRLERARDFLESHYLEDPSTARLADEAAISRAHFIRLFGSFYGISPKQRVLQLKLDEARRLLRDTDMGIWEVAEASGFGNRCAFQRMFRNRVGMTPGQYRGERRWQL